MIWEPQNYYLTEIFTARGGDNRYVQGTVYSELPKDIKYRLVVTRGDTVWKTEKRSFHQLQGTLTIGFGNFTFQDPGQYTFTLQVFKPDGTICEKSTKVYVPKPPGAGLAPGEEPVLEEAIKIGEEPLLEEAIEE
jgi:hypothetical protein